MRLPVRRWRDLQAAVDNRQDPYLGYAPHRNADECKLQLRSREEPNHLGKQQLVWLQLWPNYNSLGESVDLRRLLEC